MKPLDFNEKIKTEVNLVVKRIYESIQNADLSYGDLSQITGIAKSALHRYATGQTQKIPIEAVRLIADATGVSTAYLMGWEDEPRLTNYISFTPSPSPQTQTLLVFNKNGIKGAHEVGLPSDDVLNEINKLAQSLKAYPAEQIKALYKIVQNGGNIPMRADMPQDIKELVATVLNLSEENRKALIQVAKSMK